MIVMAREPDAEADFTLQDFLSFDTPEGYRAELIDGEIVVTHRLTATMNAALCGSSSRFSPQAPRPWISPGKKD